VRLSLFFALPPFTRRSQRLMQPACQARMGPGRGLLITCNILIFAGLRIAIGFAGKTAEDAEGHLVNPAVSGHPPNG
jgi:hypothetical protein